MIAHLDGYIVATALWFGDVPEVELAPDSPGSQGASIGREGDVQYLMRGLQRLAQQVSVGDAPQAHGSIQRA